ncbi:MAG: DUF3127 domain-containing protein [Bacteroidetes bacterium]|nr:DUF3127 domain-containing protein [Bacteroidota bacterium]
MEISGKIIKKLDVVTGSTDRGNWQKQEFIIETEDKFPKKVCISAWANGVEDLKKFEIGANVKCSLNAESREYNNRWYTDLRFWKIETAGANNNNSNNSMTSSTSQAPPVMDESNEFGAEGTNDDLPF